MCTCLITSSTKEEEGGDGRNRTGLVLITIDNLSRSFPSYKVKMPFTRRRSWTAFGLHHGLLGGPCVCIASLLDASTGFSNSRSLRERKALLAHVFLYGPGPFSESLFAVRLYLESLSGFFFFQFRILFQF
jgi:hypothetical protein